MPPKRVEGNNRWSILPDGLLELILQRLPVLDYLRVALVCTSWRAVVTARRVPSAHQPPQLSRLSVDRHCLRRMDWFDFSTGRTVGLHLPDGYRGWKCCGASYGWLVMASWPESRMCLVNPISKARIDLPTNLYPWIMLTFEAGRRHFCTHAKVVMSSAPDSGDCWTAAMVGAKQIASCRVGDDKWTVLDPGLEYYDDIVFCKGRLYALGFDNELLVCSFKEEDDGRESSSIGYYPLTLEIHDDLNNFSNFLVESSGEILRVMVHCNNNDLFYVFKLDEDGMRWVHVKNLGDRILFIGNTCSESFTASDFIMGSGELRRNSIYFKDCFESQVLLLSMEDGSVRRTGLPVHHGNCRGGMVWFMPSRISARVQHHENDQMILLINSLLHAVKCNPICN